MTPLEVLIATRSLLSAPERWTTYAYARDAAGAQTHETDERAVCFCLSGAMYRVGGDVDSQSGARAILRRVLDGDTLVEFNDYTARSHSDVIAVLDAAVALAESEAR